jgi:hypothetical protein
MDRVLTAASIPFFPLTFKSRLDHACALIRRLRALLFEGADWS